MRSFALRRLIGLLALLTFALVLPMQGVMAGCGPSGAAMDHGAGKAGCGQGCIPSKAAMSSSCGLACGPLAALPTQAAAPVADIGVVHVGVVAWPWPGRATAPDPFPPRSATLT